MDRIGNIIKEEVGKFLNENNDNEALADYFSNTWSKDANVINQIKGSFYLKSKYGSYLTYSEEEWHSMSYEDLLKIWNAWDVDYLTKTTMRENEYTPSDDEMNTARKTSRTQKYDPEVTKGRGIGEALVPSFAMNLALKTQMVLDFGAGKHPFYVMKYRDMGYDIYGWDLPDSMKYWEENYEEEIQPPGGLNKQFDMVYASNVLNVAPSEEFLKRMTLDMIKSALKSGGMFIGNFPASPRKNPEMTPQKLYEILNEYFEGVQYFNDKKIYLCTGLK